MRDWKLVRDDVAADDWTCLAVAENVSKYIDGELSRRNVNQLAAATVTDVVLQCIGFTDQFGTRRIVTFTDNGDIKEASL
jgi:hypothetical protein